MDFMRTLIAQEKNLDPFKKFKCYIFPKKFKKFETSNCSISKKYYLNYFSKILEKVRETLQTTSNLQRIFKKGLCNHNQLCLVEKNFLVGVWIKME